MTKASLIPKIEAQIKGVLIALEDLRNGSMRSTLTFKVIKEENDSTWEDSARVLGKFISTKLDMIYTDDKIDMFIRRAHRDSQRSAKIHHKAPRSLFTQFTNWRFAEEVRNRIISITSRRVLIVYVNQMFFKELTERFNKALKYI